MNTTKLIAIRKQIGVSQEVMASLLRCATVSYKRYELGTRAIPTYIAHSAYMLSFLYKNDLQKKFELFLQKDLQ